MENLCAIGSDDSAGPVINAGRNDPIDLTGLLVRAIMMVVRGAKLDSYRRVQGSVLLCRLWVAIQQLQVTQQVSRRGSFIAP